MSLAQLSLEKPVPGTHSDSEQAIVSVNSAAPLIAEAIFRNLVNT
jgi:hypothetical protein